MTKSTIYDVAKYILSKLGKISTMKLQKLCYYCQAWSLVWDDMPLFEEEFQAWANGPVCQELFSHHKGMFNVDYNAHFLSIGNIDNLTDNQKDTIDKVLEHYGDKNAQWLSTLTHMEKPWQEARNGIPEGWNSEEIITKESMAMYYGSL